ncbi:MAG TPA: glycoside hydrolase family 31 protein [Chitinispirillaceae bacterium]|nr:glycoside hydrolase family 31 protein [Chitinispirillaceae bacterium]
MKRISGVFSCQFVLKWYYLTVLMVASGVLGLSTINAYTVESAQKVDDGVIYTMSDASKMKIQVCTDKIIRVIYTKKASFPPADSNYMVVKASWPVSSFTYDETSRSIQTGTLRIDIANATGAISFYSGSSLILQETAGKTLTAKTIGGQAAYGGTIAFNSEGNEGIYGFGQFQNGLFNQRGQSLEMKQQNQKDCSPFFMSTRGFGVLWANYSKMEVKAPLTWTSNWVTNDAIDYYFIYGPEFDNIIASYRTITGPAPLWPKWAYGFWQCRNYYESQNEILSIVRKYREKGYPIDNIVQDWQYYPQGFNGSQSFDKTRYPDPAKMIKTLHDSLNCHFTISVWPSFTETPGNNNFYTMESKGYLLSVSDYLGRTYDAFNDSSTKNYWKFINDSLISKDVDAFWPDATEPESVGWAECQTSAGPAAKVENLFPLLHSKTLYEGYRSANNDKKRVCNLTRSYYAGSQRLGAAYWTGDINTDFSTYALQVPACLNVCMTGLPLVCTDVGGFWGDVTSDVMTRWFQWGIFNPVFRVHGTRNSNELWAWGEETEAILLKYSKLRYRIFPYVYSLAWKVTNDGYTMMRGLPFDFRNDPAVRDLGDEFMFGPAFLVCPITTSGANSRTVYFPVASGTWYDFWTGEKIDAGTAGKTITAQAPIQTMPIYIRAGSIVPMGPNITYADTVADPIELRVYTGADGEFTLYEDEGDGYAYEKGAHSTIKIEWNESSNNLIFHAREGSFAGMLANRKFNIVWAGASHGTGIELTNQIDKSIEYSGGKITLNKLTGEIGVVSSPKVSLKQQYKMKVNNRRFEITATGKSILRVDLFDLHGRRIAEKTIDNNVTSVIAEKLVPGLYVVAIQSYEGLINRTSFIIQ